MYSTEDIVSLTALAGMYTTSRSPLSRGPVMSSAAELVIRNVVTVMVIVMPT